MTIYELVEKINSIREAIGSGVSSGDWGPVADAHVDLCRLVDSLEEQMPYEEVEV